MSKLFDLSKLVELRLRLYQLFAYLGRLLITFANSLYQDQDCQDVRHDLDTHCLTLWWYSCKKLEFRKNQQMTKTCKLPSKQNVN